MADGSGCPGVVETVYLGGGTPTIDRDGGGSSRRTRAESDSRYVKTPRSPSRPIPIRSPRELLEALVAAGVNRISLGVQSFVASETAILGRVHTVEEARARPGSCSRAGLELSVDLMCGIPGQTAATWTETLEKAVATGADHISAYPLTLEDGTPLDVAVGTGLVPEPDPDLAAELMVMAEEYLAVEGIERYETANYARPGHECRHNIAYWTGRTLHGTRARRPRHARCRDGCALHYGCQGAGQGAGPRGQRRRARRVGVGCCARDRVAGQVRGGARRCDARAEAGARDRRRARARGGSRRDPVRAPGARASSSTIGNRWRTTRRGWLLGNEVFSAVWNG